MKTVPTVPTVPTQVGTPKKQQFCGLEGVCSYRSYLNIYILYNRVLQATSALLGKDWANRWEHGTVWPVTRTNPNVSAVPTSARLVGTVPTSAMVPA